MVLSSSQRIHIFVSHVDNKEVAPHLASLKVHLAPYVKDGSISDYLWTKESIAPGAMHDKETRGALEQADVAIILVNAAYLADTTIQKEEVQPLLAASEQRGLRLIPLILGSCAFAQSPLHDLQPAHDPNEYFSQALDKDQWWAGVALRITLAIKSLLDGRPSGAEPAGTNIDMRQSMAAEVERKQGGEKPPAGEGMASAPARDDAACYKLYKEKLLNDTGITRLQILDMSNPLAVSDIYVKVRLHKNPRPRGMLDPEMETMQDPLTVLALRQRTLEQRSSTALDPAFALRQYRRCVIVGDPGAGKTTLLKRLTVQSLQGELPGLSRLPIYVRLNEAARANWDSLLDFVLASWERTYGLAQAEMRPFVEGKLHSGEALFLLDALDEAVIGNDETEAEATYKRVADEIQRLSRRYAVPIVVTARKAGYFQRSQLTGFTELEVLDFLPTEIDQFIARWFRYYGDESRKNIADRLTSDLKKRPYIATLAANPLLLTLIIITYESNDQQFPENRARLYRECIDTFLKNWDAKRSIGRFRYFNTDTQRQLLTHIGGYFHEQRRSYFSEDELLAQIREFLESTGEPLAQAPQILQEITSENGLLREQAQRIYGFLHLTIQEYFAAEAIRTAEQVLTHLADPWWEEVILLFAGQTHDAGPLLAHLVAPATNTGEIPEDIFASKLMLAGRCLAAHPRISKAHAQLRQEIPNRLFDEFSFNEYSLVRKQAVEVLAQIGRTYPEQDINDRLLALLNDKAIDAAQKGAILSALGSHGSRVLGPSLLTMLLERRFDWINKTRAAVAGNELETVLGNLCDVSVLPRLFAILPDDEMRTYVNTNIVSLIGRIGGTTVIPRLTALLNDTHTPLRMRRDILQVSGTYGDASVLPTLVKWLTDSELAQSCVSALLELNEPSAAAYLREHVTIPLLQEPYVRLLAIVDDPALLKSPIEVLLDAKIPVDTRSEIAGILFEHGDETLRARLLDLVDDVRVPEPIRSSILLALFDNATDGASMPRLQSLRRSEHLSQDLQDQITLILGKLGDHTMLPELTRLLIEVKARRGSTFRDEFNIAVSIAKCASPTALISMLTDTRFSSTVRMLLLSTMSERVEFANPIHMQALLAIAANRKVIHPVRMLIIGFLVERLAYDEGTVKRLVGLFSPRFDLKDEVHSALWAVCRRAGVTVVADGPGGELRVVRR